MFYQVDKNLQISSQKAFPTATKFRDFLIIELNSRKPLKMTEAAVKNSITLKGSAAIIKDYLSKSMPI